VEIVTPNLTTIPAAAVSAEQTTYPAHVQAFIWDVGANGNDVMLHKPPRLNKVWHRKHACRKSPMQSSSDGRVATQLENLPLTRKDPDKVRDVLRLEPEEVWARCSSGIKGDMVPAIIRHIFRRVLKTGVAAS
jgi:hypothetical protein